MYVAQKHNDKQIFFKTNQTVINRIEHIKEMEKELNLRTSKSGFISTSDVINFATEHYETFLERKLKAPQ